MDLKSTFNSFSKKIMPYFGLTDEPVQEQLDNIIIGGALGTIGAIAGGYIAGSIGVAIGGFALSYLGNKYGDTLMPKSISFEQSPQIP